MPPEVYSEDQPCSDEVGQGKRSTVREERQGYPGNGYQAHDHRGVVEHMESEGGQESHDEQDSDPVPGPTRHLRPVEYVDDVQCEDQSNTEKPQKLRS